MKAARLDQILFRLDFVTDDQVKQALLRQKSHGGRLGSHLLFYKFITEEQLAQALSEQFEVACFIPEEHKINPDIARELPVEAAQDLQILPFDYDKRTDTLSLAVADPADTQTIAKVKRGFGVSRVEIFVCPESVLGELIERHHHGASKSIEAKEIIELPELFEVEADLSGEASTGDDVVPVHEERGVLMISNAAALKNFLGPIFQREGYTLSVMSDHESVRDALKETDFDHVLVSQDMVETFSEWQKDSRLPSLHAEVSVFSSVSHTLLENPAPYVRMARSLFRTLQIVAEMRSADAHWTPPYTPICKDIRDVARRFGFRRLAIDGIQLAVHLLVPSVAANRWDSPDEELPFHQFEASVDYARMIHYPWRLDTLLNTMRGLHTKKLAPDASDTINQEYNLAAQILSIVWYRHVVLQRVDDDPEDITAMIRFRLREQAGILASLEVIEVYLQRLEERDDALDVGGASQILIVSKTDAIAQQYSSRFERGGCRTVWTDDLTDAQQMCERQSPTAVLIDYDSFADEIGQFSRMVKLVPEVLLYALVESNDPSVTLDLLDAGVDDVLGPPHDPDIIAARINRAIRGVSRHKGKRQQPGGFNATFDAFSFLDLIQTLGQSLKSVRIDLTRGSGEQAVIYMNEGRLVHAIAGKVKGAEAVYHVIRWEEDGAFSVEPVEKFPTANIKEANESILMEGCRLLDESRV